MPGPTLNTWVLERPRQWRHVYALQWERIDWTLEGHIQLYLLLDGSLRHVQFPHLFCLFVYLFVWGSYSSFAPGSVLSYHFWWFSGDYVWCWIFMPWSSSCTLPSFVLRQALYVSCLKLPHLHHVDKCVFLLAHCKSNRIHSVSGMDLVCNFCFRGDSGIYVQIYVEYFWIN